MKIRKTLSVIGLSVLLASTYLPSADASEQPDRFTTRDRGDINLDYHVHEIENVPHYYMEDYSRYSGSCALIAMTNLIIYHDKTSFPQLVSTDDWKRVTDRVATLSNFEKQKTFYISQYKGVLEGFIAEHNLSNSLEVKVISKPTYADIEHYVSQDYPVQLSLKDYDYGPWHEVDPNSGHSVVVKGIVRMGDVKNVILRSGWKGVPDNAYHSWDDLQKLQINQMSVIVRK